MVKTSLLLPNLCCPTVPTSTSLGCNTMRSLYGVYRPYHLISVVRYFTYAATPIRTDAYSRPIHYTWDRVDESISGHCFDVDKFFVGSGSVNVVLNFIVFILVGSMCHLGDRRMLIQSQPIPLLWRLRTTVRQQIVLTAIFTLAGLWVSSSIFDK